MWLVFSILAGVFYSSEDLLKRFLLRAKKDPWAYSFFYSFIGAIISFPFMIASPQIPDSAEIWLLALLVGALVVANNLLVFMGSGKIEASMAGAIFKLRLVWVFVLDIIFLNDPFSWQKLAGAIFTISAGLVIIHAFRKVTSGAGVALILGATIFNAAIIILSKYLLEYFNAPSLAFFAWFLPVFVLNALLMPKAAARTKKLFKEDWRIVVLACGFGALGCLALSQALSLHDASSVLIITEAFLVVVLVGEHIFLKEKEYLWVKVVSIALAIVGACLIQASS